MTATAEFTLAQIAAALGTEEEGAALVEVARNAHKAEQELATLKIKVTELAKPGQELNIHEAIDVICDIYNVAK